MLSSKEAMLSLMKSLQAMSFWEMFKRLKDISTPDFSTPSFNSGPFNPRLFNHELFNPRLFNHDFLKSGVKKFMVEKSGVERSRVEAWGWKVQGWDVLQLFKSSKPLTGSEHRFKEVWKTCLLNIARILIFLMVWKLISRIFLSLDRLVLKDPWILISTGNFR